MPQTKQQQLYEVLRERILSGSYGPGYRIVIDQIAADFGVSALPVREAIRRLEAEGLLIYRANAGAQVAPAEPETFEENMTLLAVLDGFASGLASSHLSEQDVETLQLRTDEMAVAMERMDSVAFGRRNREFHEVFYARCPNESVVHMLRDVERRLDAIRSTVFVHIPYRGASSITEHHELIDLVKTGAPSAEIERVAREHKMRTVESFQEWQQGL